LLRREAPGLALGLGVASGSPISPCSILICARRHGATFSERLEGLLGAKRLLELVAAWYGQILRGTPLPESAGGRIAFKTGIRHRDAWAVGFDGRRTIGVWVGRPDGAPVSGLAGRTAAAPILFDAFARGPQPLAPLPPAPAGATIATTSKLPPPLQRFQPHTVTAASFTRPLHIVFPPNGASLELSERRGTDPFLSRSPAARRPDGDAERRAACGQNVAPARCSSPLKVRASCASYCHRRRAAADSVPVRLQ
jgi:penicillin-binding protein 1C